MHPIVAAALLTIAVETPVAAAVHGGARWRVALTAVGVNAATNPLMNLTLRLLPTIGDDALWLAEILVVAVEAVVYRVAVPTSGWGMACAVSGLANAASFLVGRWALV